MRTVLHLVRPGAPPPLVAAHDWVVYLQDLAFVPGPAGVGAPGLPPTPPPISPGQIDHDQLLTLCFAADVVVTW